MPISYTNKFNRGEVAEEVLARDDVPRVSNSCSLMDNFLPLRAGPMQYRPGTEYLGEVFDNESHFLIPWVDDGTTPTILEFSQSDANPSIESVRFWIDGELQEVTATKDTITNGTFTTDLTGWTSNNVGTGSVVYQAANTTATPPIVQALTVSGGEDGVGRATQTLTMTAGKRPLRLHIARAPICVRLGTGTTVDSNDIFDGLLNPGIHLLTFTAEAGDHILTLSNDQNYFGAVELVQYDPAGELRLFGAMATDTTGSAAVLQTMQFAQINDVMFLVDDGYSMGGESWPFWTIKRRGRESWSFELPDITDGPWGPINSSNTTLRLGATTGDTTLTASAPLFTIERVNDIYRLQHITDEGTDDEEVTLAYCKVTGFVSTTQVNVRITQEAGATTATKDWWHGQFGRYLPGPTAVELFQGRLWLSGGTKIYASVSDLFTSFDEDLEGDSRAIQKTMAFGPTQDVAWLKGGKTLMSGLSSEEVQVRADSEYRVVSQSNVQVIRGTTKGSAPQQPQIVDQDIYFAGRGLKKLWALKGLEGVAIEAMDSTLLNPEINAPGIKRIFYSSEPEPRIYCLLTDGELRVLLFDPVEQVTAWSRITLEGATVIDIAVSPTTSEDQLYLIVQRGDNKYFERMAPIASARGGSISRHFDGHVYMRNPGATFDGLDHLEGRSVHIWADGVDRGAETVSGGEITLPESTFQDVVVGLRHKGQWRSNRMQDYDNETALSSRKRVVKLGCILRNVSIPTFFYGPREDDLYQLPAVEEGSFRQPTTEETLQVLAREDSSDACRFDATILAVVGGDTIVHPCKVSGNTGLREDLVYAGTTADGDEIVYLIGEIPDPGLDRVRWLIYDASDGSRRIVQGFNLPTIVEGGPSADDPIPGEEPEPQPEAEVQMTPTSYEILSFFVGQNQDILAVTVLVTGRGRSSTVPVNAPIVSSTRNMRFYYNLSTNVWTSDDPLDLKDNAMPNLMAKLQPIAGTSGARTARLGYFDLNIRNPQIRENNVLMPAIVFPYTSQPWIYDAGAVVITQGTGTGRIYIYGGIISDPGSRQAQFDAISSVFTTTPLNAAGRWYYYDIASRTFNVTLTRIDPIRNLSRPVLFSNGNGKIYLYGGQRLGDIGLVTGRGDKRGRPSTEMWEYDIATDDWTQVTFASTDNPEGFYTGFIMRTAPRFVGIDDIPMDTRNIDSELLKDVAYANGEDNVYMVTTDEKTWRYTISTRRWTDITETVKGQAGTLAGLVCFRRYTNNSFRAPSLLQLKEFLGATTTVTSLNAVTVLGVAFNEAEDVSAILVKEGGTDGKRGILIAQKIDDVWRQEHYYQQPSAGDDDLIATAIAISGRYVYVPDFDEAKHLSVYDLTRASDALVRKVRVENQGDKPPLRMGVAGLLGYFATGDSVNIIGLSNPESGIDQFFLRIQDADNDFAEIHEGRLFIMDRDAGTLRIFDATGLLIPETVGEFTHDGMISANDWGFLGQWLLVANDTQVTVYNLIDPANPSVYVEYTGVTDVQAIKAVIPPTAIVGVKTTPRSLQALNLANPQFTDYDEYPFEFPGELSTDPRVFIEAVGPVTVLSLRYEIEDTDYEETDPNRDGEDEPE